MKQHTPLHVSFNISPARPSFKILQEHFVLSGKRCLMYLYIWNETSSCISKIHNIQTFANSASRCHLLSRKYIQIFERGSSSRDIYQVPQKGSVLCFILQHTYKVTSTCFSIPTHFYITSVTIRNGVVTIKALKLSCGYIRICVVSKNLLCHRKLYIKHFMSNWHF